MRIGHGYDVHAFGEGNALVLGGVCIPYSSAFVAHSDGDVLIHALMDALLGALALGDIGQHFPDTDPAYRDSNSRDLLARVVTMIVAEGYVLSNADMTIVAQSPRMAPYLETMRLNLAMDLDCDVQQLNIKATTTEKMGYVGRQEGMACYASVLLKPLVAEDRGN